MWTQIVSGAIGGIAYSLTGLAKTQGESFDWKKMIPTVIVGLVLGGIAGLTNQEYGVVIDTVGIAGMTALVENCGKAIYRKVSINK